MVRRPVHGWQWTRFPAPSPEVDLASQAVPLSTGSRGMERAPPLDIHRGLRIGRFASLLPSTGC